jgi:RimJ/RimL family protein N-acetyltransferase
MMETLETERLILRRFAPDDGADLFEYLSDEETVKYEPYGVLTLAQAQIEAARRATDEAFWAVCQKETGRLIGNVYFCRQQPEQFKTWEIGYVFNRGFTGHGYAMEAVLRVMRFGFEELGAHRIEAHCNPENERSWKLLERVHMRREGHFQKKAFFKYDASGRPLWHDAYAYGMLDEEWKGLNGSRA